MAKTNLQRLFDLGQSPWLDNITRGLITSGDLQALIDKGIVGVTANPTIFEKALAGSADYDTSISELFRQNKVGQRHLHVLLIEDITAAADLFRPVYDDTDGVDGYISIEVDPDLARDTPEHYQPGRRCSPLPSTAPTSSSKCPATEEGIPAIEELPLSRHQHQHHPHLRG